MSTHEQQTTNNPTSAVRNTGGRNGPQGLEEPMSDEVLREMCDKNYHQLLPLIAEKMQKEKEQKDKLNAVKARLIYGDEYNKLQSLIYGEESGIKIRSREESHYSESKTPTARTEPRRRHGDRYSRSPSPHASVFKRLKKYRSPSPRPRPRKEGGVFNRLGRKEPATSACSGSRQRSPQAKRTEVEARRRQQKGTPSRTTSQYSESEGGHWKSKSRRRRSNTYEDDLSQPWTCEERNPFTPRIRHFSLPRTRMPSHVKTYDGSGDPEDHLKLFQSAAKTEGWAMPTWCHMFNSTLTGNARVWFDKLPKESIDSYEDLRTAFRENYLQQTKHIKDPVEIHHIKQRDGESTEDFMERYKAEVLDVEGAPECMRISGFMHGITHPGLIKRLYERIPRSMDEMYRMTTSFLQGEVAAFSHSQRKVSSSWKPSEGGNKPNFKKGFKNKQRPDRKPDRFSLLTKTPKEIFALEKGKFKAPPPMHGRMHAAEKAEMIKAGKLSQFIKELKQNDKLKAPKRGEVSGKDKPLTILMIQPWERVAKPRITQSFSLETAISFPPLREEDRTEGPMIIEVEMGGHFVHRVYIDGRASSKVLYEHCFIKLRKEIRDQMVPATTHLIGFSGETIWTLGQIALLVKIGNDVHSTSGWMNFMVIRSPSQHNAIIGRPGIRKICAVPSTAHGMLKFPVEGGTVLLQSSRIIPMECAMISGPSIKSPAVNQILEEKINIAIHPEYPEQTVAIGSTLTEKVLKELCSLLKQNLDIFAWKPAGMTGVPRKIAKHRLNIREGYSPVRQKKRGHAPERNKVIQEEVEKLVDTGIMKEVHYHSWLSNPVMVKKNDGTWRMCVDFKDLNNACPKDCYPLPEIYWKFELEGYDIQYRLRTAIKGQILADFIVERPKEESLDELMAEPEILPEPWTLFTDGSSCLDGSGAGLRIAEQMGVKNLQANVDSRLVANQVNGSYIAKESDALSKIASTSFAHLSKQVLVEELKEKSINEKEILDVVEEEGNTWMTPICEYLAKEILLENKKKARAVHRKAARYAMINGTLYKKSFLGPWLRCVGPLQANYVLIEIHEGSCSMHSGPIYVVAKVIRTGYYMPTMHMDARNLIRECNDGQIHCPIPRNPQQNLTPITSPWPFYKWGIDIAGPFPEGPGKVKFLIVAIDYFTKWIDVKAVVTITGNQVKKFVWDNIVCRFGLPGEIILDNEKQFRDNPFKDWCVKLCIRQCFASVKHPQANGLVERANRSLGEGIKARLDEKSKE
ncbi:reverse transcriptase domain-containing protein [Tanacetum coccineum]